jgi:hypothetical protein
MKPILLAIPLGFLVGIGACSPKDQETGEAKAKSTVDCHLLVIGSKDTVLLKPKAPTGETLYTTLRRPPDAILQPEQQKLDFTSCLLADTIHKPGP